MTLSVLDLFSGIGGFSLGLERTGGFVTTAFCEIEPYCQKVLRRHWKGVPIYDDVKQLTAERLRSDGISVDAICGGFPCQDVSVAGRGGGLRGERSGLWFEFHRLIDEIKPSWVIIENVSALRSRGLDEVLGSLFEVGYDAEWHCIPASAVGAPHQRDRIWIVAHSNSSNGGRRENVGDIDNQGWATTETRGESLQSQDGQTRSSDTKQSSEALAHPNSAWELQQEGTEQVQRGRIGNGSEDVADANGTGLERYDDWPSPTISPQTLATDPWASRISKWREDWAAMSDIRRVSHGVPNRAHRLRALGNSVVPQIPELIGYAILEVEKERRNAKQITRTEKTDGCGCT